MKISTAQSRLEISRILKLIFNQKKISKLRFRKTMMLDKRPWWVPVLGSFDKCVGMWAKRAREGKTIPGLDKEAVLRLEYF